MLHFSFIKHTINMCTYVSMCLCGETTQKCQPIIATNVINNKLNMLIGNKYFHSKFNNWSIRSRGNVHLNHMITNIRKKTFPINHIDEGIKSITWLKLSQCPMCSGIQPPKNNMAPMLHTIKILTYSARKNKANFIPEYSVWKPAVSSLSASARSKGARFVSAVTAMINITNEIRAYTWWCR